MVGAGRTPRTGRSRAAGIVVLVALGTLINPLGAPGEHVASAGTRPQIDLADWSIDAAEHRVQSYRGREALVLRNGTAWLRDERLEDGVIEFDIAVSEAFGFAGVAFRGVDDDDYEHFYFRPFLAGKPDACQYTPVFHGVSGWQIYTGPRFGTALEYTFDRWMHVKLVVSGSRAEIYLDSDGPVFVIPELQRAPAAGRIGLTASGAPARFANVFVHPGAGELGSAEAPPADEVPETIVRRWRVSGPFVESRFDRTRISADELGIDSWTELEVGERGIANLGRVSGIEGNRNTVVAALSLHSDRPRTARIRFGFSDRVRVFLNGQLLYAGSDGWRTRDYRFLGTIGLHDELWLRLEEGDNELWLAVSEDFGGWGVVMDLPERAGLRVEFP